MRAVEETLDLLAGERKRLELVPGQPLGSGQRVAQLALDLHRHGHFVFDQQCRVDFWPGVLGDQAEPDPEDTKAAKPSGAKGTYIKSVTFTSTMGPGIRVDVVGAQNMQASA